MHCPTTVLSLKVTLVQQDRFGTEFETNMEDVAQCEKGHLMSADEDEQ